MPAYFGEGLLSVHCCHLLTVSLQRGKGKTVVSGLFYKDTDPSPEGSTLITTDLPGSPPPYIITKGIQFQHMNLGVERHNIQIIALSPFLLSSLHSHSCSSFFSDHTPIETSHFTKITIKYCNSERTLLVPFYEIVACNR